MKRELIIFVGTDSKYCTTGIPYFWFWNINNEIVMRENIKENKIKQWNENIKICRQLKKLYYIKILIKLESSSVVY